MKSIMKLYVLGAIALSLSSCSKDESITSTSDEVLPLEFVYDTRSNTDSEDYASNATVSFSMFPMSSLTEGTSYGIYSLSTNDDEMLSYITPLNASAGTYTMCIASTGEDLSLGGDYSDILPQTITNYTSCYGYKIYRTESNENPNLYLSSGISVTVNGILLNDAYSVDLSGNDDAVMRKHISRIYFQIKSLNDVEADNEYEIGYIKVRNLLESAFYCPMHTFHYNEIPTIDNDISLYGDGLVEFNVSSTTAIKLTDAATYGNEYIEVISGDYSEVYDATNSTMLYDTPKLVIRLSNKEDEIELPIKANLEPQTEYTYTLTMATTYITVTVAEASWDESDEPITGSVDEAYTYTVDISDDDWSNSYDNIEGTI